MAQQQPPVAVLRSQAGLSYGQVGMLSTAYNVAALLVLLAGGYVVDRWGTRNAIVAFSAICVAAAALTAMAPQFETILAGRFLLGTDASGRDIRLEVDGGIKAGNIRRVADAGADTFVAGSAIFGQPDYGAVIAQMRHELQK